MSIEQKARTLYDACPTVKPTWDQLGDVTKSVWIEYAINNREGLHFVNKFNIVQFQAASGLPLTADFIVNKLGIAPDETVKRAVFWEASKYQQVIAAVGKHLDSVIDVNPCDLNGTRPKKTDVEAEAPPPAAVGDDPFADDPFADDSFAEAEASPPAAAEADPFAEDSDDFF